MSLLMRNEPSGVAAGQIAQELRIKASTLSFHLKQLEIAGLVASARAKRNIVYRGRSEVIDDLVGFLVEECGASTDVRIERASSTKADEHASAE